MPDSDVLLGEVTLRGDAASARITDAVLDGVTLSRTIDGASTLEMSVIDTDRVLTRSGIFSSRSWALISGLGYELVSVDKAGDRLSLTFEDSLVAALRRRTAARTWAAGSITRAGLIRDLCAEVPVPAEVDPQERGTVAAAVQRSAAQDGAAGAGGAEQKDDSWTLLGTLTSDAGWRRFSTGTSVIAGSDDWLRARTQPLTLREHTGAVQGIDYRYDTGRAEATATVSIDATRDAAPIGSTVLLPDLGPASGVWLVSKYTRDLIRRRAALDLIRAAPVLPEPPPEAPPAQADQGETDLIPGAEVPAPSAAAVGGGGSAREVFLRAAMSKRGLPYIWGGTGPGGYDCSGLTQYALRAAGRPISRVVSTQYADARRAGRTISVAQGLATRGALLVRGGEHIAISLGNGSTFEARGRAYPIGEFSGAARRKWTGAFIWA